MGDDIVRCCSCVLCFNCALQARCKLLYLDAVGARYILLTFVLHSSHCVLFWSLESDFTSYYPKSPEGSLVEGASSFYAKQRVSKALASVDFKLMLFVPVFIYLFEVVGYHFVTSCSLILSAAFCLYQWHILVPQKGVSCPADNPFLIFMQVRILQ